MQGFSFRIFEDDYWCSRLDFSLLFRSKLMHSIEAETSYDYKERNGARNDSLNMENLVKNREGFLRREEPFLWKKEIRFQPSEGDDDRDRWSWLCVNSRIIAFIWWSSDRESMIEMRWWRGMYFDSPVGFRSNDGDSSIGSLILSWSQPFKPVIDGYDEVTYSLLIARAQLVILWTACPSHQCRSIIAISSNAPRLPEINL